MASGNSLGMFGAIPDGCPATNYPQFTTRNLHPLLAFDTTTQETAYWDLVLPSSYSGGGLTFIIGSVTTVTSGTIGWGVSVERDINQDYGTDNFGTETLGTPVTVNATSGKASTQTLAVSSANMASAVAGDKLRVRIRRDVANDTAAADAQLDWVEVRET